MVTVGPGGYRQHRCRAAIRLRAFAISHMVFPMSTCQPHIFQCCLMEEISKHQPLCRAHRETIPKPGLEARGNLIKVQNPIQNVRSQGFLCMKITYFKLELLPYNSSPITKPKKHKTNKICTCLVCSRGHTTLLTVPRNLISGTGGRYPVLTPRDPKFATSIHSLYNRFQDN